jgi:hypothetical protein
MTETTKRVLYWSPRILGVAFAALISLLALDVFGEGRGFGETAVALLMHLVPTAIVVAVLAISWRWEIVGGVAFLGLAVAYIAMAWGRFPLDVYVVVAGPLFLTGVLFLVGWFLKVRPSPRA